MAEFKNTAPSAEAVFYRTYSRRKTDGTRENFVEAMTRCVKAIAKTGSFTDEQYSFVLEQALGQHCFPSGRSFWVAGTEWAEQQDNFSGWYNCTSTRVVDVEAFELIMELAMMGSGTGAMLEEKFIENLPEVSRKINIILTTDIGYLPASERSDETVLIHPEDSADGEFVLSVGDSRQGWVKAYSNLISLATDGDSEEATVVIDLGNVRPAGEPLKGFGGVSNPVKLADMFVKVANILNNAIGRNLTALECSLVIDEAAACVVAGNIRRSAGMRQFGCDDDEAINSKAGLYTQDADGNWKVDSTKEALRMANHTSCYHYKPSLEEVIASVTKQFYSGEGAIQYVPEALFRANIDLLETDAERKKFLQIYNVNKELAIVELIFISDKKGKRITEKEARHRISRYGLNPCGEIIGADFHCNLAEIHLNTINPEDMRAQEAAFRAGALQVGALLHHEFKDERYRYSREVDPIVGVSFTGLFDFFVHAFGSDWLEWMMGGRPGTSIGRRFMRTEKWYLSHWKNIVRETLTEYCEDHGLKVPNRMTTVQPAGTKSLLTGAAPGWHPPKAQRFIRRITFGVDDPLVQALSEWGYSVIPAQSAKDENGVLLDDITDPRVQEVLVEIPTEVSWANLPGCDKYDLNKLPVKSQWGLYMMVQRNYTEHNTSATLEYREEEIETLSRLIHSSIEKDTGYISAALLARFDANATFPRLPFEPIDKETYTKMNKQVAAYREAATAIHQAKDSDFLSVLGRYDDATFELKGASGCDSDKCLSSADKDQDQVGQQI
jgi:ribonucleotide reductase class II